jgi:muconate cycloisomerase
MPISLQFKETYRIATGVYPSRRIIVKLHTDEGIVGLGEGIETWHYSEPLGAAISAMEIFAKGLKESNYKGLVDEDPLKMTQIIDKMDSVLHKFPNIKTAVDSALYDLIGKKLGVSISELLGGSCREKIPMACYIGVGEDPVSVAQKYISEGVKLIKLKVGTDPEKDFDNLRKLNDNFSEFPIVIDANEAYSRRHLPFFKKMEMFDNLKIIEQPCPRWNLDLMNEFRRKLNIPIMADESITSIYDAYNVIKNEAADIIKLQLRMVGGFYRAKQVINLAKCAGIPLYTEAPIYSGVGTAASLLLQSIIPDKDVVYQGGASGPLRVPEDILKEQLKCVNGEWTVPKNPGLGIEIDEKKLNKIVIDV